MPIKPALDSEEPPVPDDPNAEPNGECYIPELFELPPQFLDLEKLITEDDPEGIPGVPYVPPLVVLPPIVMESDSDSEADQEP